MPEPYATAKTTMFATMSRRAWLVGGGSVMVLGGLTWLRSGKVEAANFEVQKSDADWQRALKPAQYRVLRRHGTEHPFTSPLNHEKRAGTFACAGCGRELFSSATKFDSGTGWPSFYRPLPDAVGTSSDRLLFIPRTEVHCARCGGHLGHVFSDGPPPTGLRYCINGVALDFKPGEPAQG